MPEVCEGSERGRAQEPRACAASQCLDSGVGVRHKWKKGFPLQRIRECGRRACAIVKVFWQRLPLFLFTER